MPAYVASPSRFHRFIERHRDLFAPLWFLAIALILVLVGVITIQAKTNHEHADWQSQLEARYNAHFTAYQSAFDLRGPMGGYVFVGTCGQRFPIVLVDDAQGNAQEWLVQVGDPVHSDGTPTIIPPTELGSLITSCPQ